MLWATVAKAIIEVTSNTVETIFEIMVFSDFLNGAHSVFPEIAVTTTCKPKVCSNQTKIFKLLMGQILTHKSVSNVTSRDAARPVSPAFPPRAMDGRRAAAKLLTPRRGPAHCRQHRQAARVTQMRKPRSSARRTKPTPARWENAPAAMRDRG
jgi:hypothetical protein